MQHRNPASKRTYMISKLKHFNKKISSRGYYKLQYVVGVSPNPILSDVCKVCFLKCYRYEKSSINYMIKAIKVICFILNVMNLTLFYMNVG